MDEYKTKVVTDEENVQLKLDPAQKGELRLMPENDEPPEFAELAASRNVTFVEKLGEGAMGSVFRATDKALGCDLALKLMNKQLVGDRDALKRFEREAKAAGSLTNAHIAQVYACHADGETPYLEMEYVDGTNLARVLQHERRLSQKRLVPILLQLCEALEYAHLRGIVHRDIKPSNIILKTNHRQTL